MKFEKLQITTETVKLLTDTELREARGGLGSAECSTACTGTYTATCYDTNTTGYTCGCTGGTAE